MYVIPLGKEVAQLEVSVLLPLMSFSVSQNDFPKMTNSNNLKISLVCPALRSIVQYSCDSNTKESQLFLTRALEKVSFANTNILYRAGQYFKFLFWWIKYTFGAWFTSTASKVGVVTARVLLHVVHTPSCRITFKFVLNCNLNSAS